ncbi:NfeD family protein, partial [Paraburkholderia oxyphila]|uniref:NfeD family protein n=1 Tax=Paraburkholderia oxyphila TaxID=614212 RepID=UPI0005BE528D
LASGWALVRGERWHVACAVPLAAGSRVRVTAREGLVLSVAPLEDAPPLPVKRGRWGRKTANEQQAREARQGGHP